MLSEPIWLNMAIRSKIDKQKCSPIQMLKSAVTILTPSRPLSMHEVRQIIVEEEMDHPLIERPVLDEMGFVATQHLDSVRDKFRLHDFSNIDKELLKMVNQPSGALSKLQHKVTGIPDFFEDLPDLITLAKGKKETQRKQI
jgi:hypothetical protein